MCVNDLHSIKGLYSDHIRLPISENDDPSCIQFGTTYMDDLVEVKKAMCKCKQLSHYWVTC